MNAIEFKGDNEKEKQLNKQIFDCTLTIAQKDDEIRELKDQLQQKENIKKEIREYIKNNSYFKDNVVKTMIFKDYSNGILEILDKENKYETI